MATDREIAPIHKPATAVDDQANAQTQAGQTDRNTANAGDKPGTGRLPEVVEGQPAADAFRQQIGLDAALPKADQRAAVAAQFGRDSIPTATARETVYKNPDGTGNLTGVTTTNRDGSTSFIVARPGERPVIYDVQGAGPNAKLQLQTLDAFGTRNRPVTPGESDNKAAVPAAIPSAIFKGPGDAVTGANIRENLTRSTVQPVVQPVAEVTNTRGVVPPVKANEIQTVQTPGVIPGQLTQTNQPLTIAQANQPGVLAGRAEIQTNTATATPFKVPDFKVPDAVVNNPFNPATHRASDPINLNPGLPTRLPTDVNTGTPTKPVADINTGIPVKPVADINTGIPVKPVADINTGMPIRPMTDVTTGIPVRPMTDVTTGMPVRPMTDVTTGMPVRPMTDVTTGIPVRPMTDVTTGMPARPMTDANTGMPVRPMTDANTGMPVRPNFDLTGLKPGDIPQVRPGDMPAMRPGDIPGVRPDLSQILKNPGDLQANLQNIALTLSLRNQDGRLPGVAGDTTIKPLQALDELALRLKDMNMSLKPGDKPGAEFIVKFDGTRSDIGKGLAELGTRIGADGKLEIKFDGKSDAKIDAKDAKLENAVVKPETVDLKTDAKADPKVDAKLETLLDHKESLKTETKIDAKAETQAESKIEAKTEAKIDAKTETKTDAKADVKSEIKTEAKADTKIESELVSQVKTDSRSGSKPDLDTKIDNKAESRPEPMGDKATRPDKQEPVERPEVHVPNSFETDREGVKSETTIADRGQSDRPEGKLPDEKEKGREAEEREEEDRARNAAIAALMAVKKKQQQEEKENLLQNDKSKKDEDKRRRYVVKEKDTLETIAKKQLRDIRLAALIYEINKHMLPVRLEKGKQIIEPRPGSSIWLPSESEIKEFRSRLYAAPKSGSSILQQSSAAKGKQSAEEELEGRFGDNWDGSAKISAGMMGAAVAKNQNRRANIEKILGPMGSKPTDSSRIRYIVRLSDTLDGVAAKHPAIKDADMWPLIARLNELSEDEDDDGKPLAELRRGMVLTLPLPQEIELYKNPPLDFSADDELQPESDQERRPTLMDATASGDSITTILSRSNTASMPAVLDDEQPTVVLPQANAPTLNLEPVKKAPVIPAPMPLASPSLSSPPIQAPIPASAPEPVAPIEPIEPAQPQPRDVATSDILPAVPTRPMQPVVSLLGPPQNVGGRLIWNLDASVRLVKSSVNWDSTIGVYRSQLELLLSGTWYPVVFYEVTADSANRHEFAPGNRKRSVRIDLPPVAVQEMSDNDLLANWRGYCQRYVSQLPPG